MQRPAGRRDPFRVGVRGEQRRLLGVAAKAAVDHQIDTVGRGGRRHAVERCRDVGAHRLALAVGERAGVFTGGGRADGSCPTRWHELGFGRHSRRQRCPRERDLIAHGHTDPQRRQRVTGKADLDVVGTVPLSRRDGDAPADRDVLGALEVTRVRAPVDHRRREHARIHLVQRAGARQCGEVGRALVLTAHADDSGDAAEDERAQCHGDEGAGDEWHRLTLLGEDVDPWHAGQPRRARVTGLRRVCTDSAPELQRISAGGIPHGLM
jgi:hypothetical protein